MNTVWLESTSTNQALTDTSTGDSSTGDRTRMRITPPPDVQFDAADPEVEELPIARLMLSQGRAPHTSTKAPSAPLAPDRPAGLPLIVLTTDTTFANQLRVALDNVQEVRVVASMDAAAELAAARQCPILITDIAMPRSALDSLTARLRAHDPATAMIVAGNRDQGGMFIGMQSSGAVDGFLLKPVTAAATQLVIEAATRRYRAHGNEPSNGSSRRLRHRVPGRKERSLAVAPGDMDSAATIAARAPVRADAIISPLASAQAAAAPRVQPLWVLVAIVAVAVVGGAWWLTTQRTTGIDPNQIAAKHLALGDRAFTAGRLLDARDGAVHHYQTVLAVDAQNFAAQAGLDRIAQELSRQTQAHMARQRLADAALSLARLRELQPDYPELPLLDSQLQLLQDTVLASRTPRAATPPIQQAPLPPSQNNARRAAVPDRVQPARIEAPTVREPKQGTTSLAASGATAVRTGTDTLEAAKSTIAQPNAQAPAIANAQAPAIAEQVSAAPRAPEAESEAASAEQLAEASSARAPSPYETQPAAAPSAPVAPEALQTTPSKSDAPPTLLKYVPPAYPADAVARRMEGWVEVSMEITPNGDVLDPRIERGEKRQLFGRAALAAVRQWKYEPNATRAAGSRSSVRLRFKLD
jgi:TonB family protein